MADEQRVRVALVGALVGGLLAAAAVLVLDRLHGPSWLTGPIVGVCVVVALTSRIGQRVVRWIDRPQEP